MSADHTKVTTERTDQEKYFNKLERTLNLYTLAMRSSLPVLEPFIHFQLKPVDIHSKVNEYCTQESASD